MTQSVEDAVRTTLAARAGKLPLPADLRRGIDGRARRIRRRRHAVAATAATAVLAVAVAVPAVLDSARQPRPVTVAPAAALPTSYQQWPARGELADDEMFLATVVSSWDRGDRSPGPHTDVRPLWLDGHGAVVLGTAAGGSRRLAILLGGSLLISDKPAPESLDQVSFTRLHDERTRPFRQTLVVVGPPDATRIEWASNPGGVYRATPHDNGTAVIDIGGAGPEARPQLRILRGRDVVCDPCDIG